MNDAVVKTLTEKACASVRYRTRKEILDENPDINDYLDEILSDNRVKYVFSWQKPDGYLGQCFHGGRIPEAKSKQFSTGAEAGLRFLSEIGVPKNHPVIVKALNALLKDNWKNNDLRWTWAKSFNPEIGLFGLDNVRAGIFVYFGIEDYEFIKTEIRRTLSYIINIIEISSIKDITGKYQNKLFYNKGVLLPDIYNLRLLAFSKSWRNSRNINIIAKALEH